jgi:AcrR family transcriptional regulator
MSSTLGPPVHFDREGVPVSRTDTATDTKTRILDAALETIRTKGLAASSARAIAATGDFNQALIFYHFGSVNDLMLAVLDRLTARRMARYRERMQGETTLSGLVRVAAELHSVDVDEGHMTVLAQMLSSALDSPEQKEALRVRFDPWIDLVEDAVEQVVVGTPYEPMIPTRDLAQLVVSMFMGISLLHEVEDDIDEHEQHTFGTLQMMAMLIEQVLDAVPDPDAPSS